MFGRNLFFACALALQSFLALSACDGVSTVHPADEKLRLNHIQLKATHNSYRPGRLDHAVVDWRYDHAPILVQLEEQGVRGLEFDLIHDPFLERYRVEHIPEADDETHCPFLTDCLEAVRDFSERHPGHHPIFIQIEPRGAFDDDTEARIARFESEVLSVFDRAHLITPDDVRGEALSLREAVRERGWPTLGETRGKIFIYLDSSREISLAYAGPDGRLEGRVAFPDSRMDDPFAGFMVINAVGDGRAREAVEAGFLVRVRAEHLRELFNEGVDRAEAALETGAQVISTDFPVKREELDYFFDIPGGTPSRCSPVTAPEDCKSEWIEDPSRLGG